MAAFDYDLSPILLLSNLSEHTTNIKNNSLVSLMICEENNLYNFFQNSKTNFLILTMKTQCQDRE